MHALAFGCGMGEHRRRLSFLFFFGGFSFDHG